MKRNLLYAATLLAAVSVLITPIAALADKGPVAEIGAVEITVDTRPHRLAENTITEATGKTWIDADTGERLYEYTARIDSAPEYIGNTRIDCTWHQETPGQWAAGANLFTATVTNRLTKVKYDDNNLIWSPQVFVGGVEYTCDKEPELLPVDPINENYHNNTLSWDYGVCERRLRLIEGMISEVYIFERDPGADVQIKTNDVKDRGFEGETPVFAYDAAGNSIPISADKVVKAADLKGAAYPVTIDPTEVFVTSASDGYIVKGATTYNAVWTSATGIENYWTTYIIVGQVHGDPVIYRGFVYFDTSALPDGATISSATLSLYGKSDGSATDFNIVIQNGMPTYPHDLMVAEDFDKSHYSGDGGSLTTVGFSTAGYNNISLNADGRSWVDKSGTTKFALRSNKDIAGIAPLSAGIVDVYSYEKGAGYRPMLYVTYVSSGPPDVSSVAATYVTKTTARVNGYLDSDGGEATTVWFNYWEWYNANWSDCIEFSINASYVDSDLTNFPVLITGAQVNESNPNFWTTVDVNGSDILFTDENGVKLNRELVSIDTSAQTMECYVNVTTIDDAIDTPIYMYYGANVSTHNDSNSTDTWNSDYVAVYHMGDLNTSAISDSTVNGFTGIKTGANEPIESSGSFDGDISQLFDGTNDKIEITDNAKLDFTTAMTVETIYNLEEWEANNGLVSKDRSTDRGWTFSESTTQLRMQWYDSVATSKSIVSGTMNARIHEWIYADIRYNAGTGQIYVDGSASGSPSTDVSNQLRTNAINVFIGKNNYDDIAARYLNGSITEVRLSNTSRSVDWIESTYYSLMQPENFCPVTDVFHETATQSKNTGDSFYSSLTGLTANTLYGFRAMGTQTQGTDYGAWLTFTTLATNDGPLSLYAYPDATYIDLSWLKGVGAVNTLVRYNVGSYPSSTAGGNLVYSGPASAYTHTGLTSGTTYYYRAWSDDGLGVYSANYSSVMCTTLAGSPDAGATPEAPDMPSNWFGSPDYTNMADAPLYDMWNAVADSMEMPRNSFWMLLTILNIILISFILFFISKGNLIVAVGASAVCMAAAGAIELISFWYVGIYLIAAIALSYRAVTR